MTELPQLSVDRPRTVTIAVEGEIGEAELQEIFEMLLRTAKGGVRNVVMDFTHVTHFDHRGVQPLVARADLFRRAGGDIKLCGLSPSLWAIFRSAGAHDAFDCYACAAEARQAFDRAVFVAS